MLNFLKEYGGISLAEAPLCDADRLVFAQLVYIDLHAAAVGDFLKNALQKADFSGTEDSEVRFGFQSKDDMKLCAAVADAERYSRIRLVDFFRCAEDGYPFAAMTLELPDGSRLIVYRGTDNTIAGWKEDFDLAFRPELPSHRRAVNYAAQMSAGECAFELIGHSKGGHLALYAASGLSDDAVRRLRAAVSFDGPGFSQEMLECRNFSAIIDRACVIMPRSSVVGMLFTQPVERLFVESRSVSLLQHYPYFWKICNGGFVASEKVSPSARIFGKTVQGLMEEMCLEDREKLIESVYEIISATHAHTLNDILRGWFMNAIPVARALLGRDKDTYKLFIRTIMAFLRSAARALDFHSTEDE